MSEKRKFIEAYLNRMHGMNIIASCAVCSLRLHAKDDLILLHDAEFLSWRTVSGEHVLSSPFGNSNRFPGLLIYGKGIKVKEDGKVMLS